MLKCLLKIVAIPALLLIGLSCGVNTQLGKPEYTLPDVPDEPVWKVQDESTLQLTVAKETRYLIPHLGTWNPPTYSVNPVFVEYENGSFVLYGVHRSMSDFSDLTTDEERRYGVNRWVIGEEEIETSMFSEFRGVCFYALGADYPENPGPEYLLISFVRGAFDVGYPDERVMSLFGVDGTEIASIDMDPRKSPDIINSLPLDYPCNDTFLDHTHDDEYDRVYEVYNFGDGGSTYIDPRAAPNVDLHWIAETREWMYRIQRTVDGIERWDIIDIEPDGTFVYFEPWKWPEYSLEDGGYEFHTILDIPPVFIDGHRHFILYTAAETSERKIDRWWLVRYDPGESASPVWCRDEPYVPRPNERVMLFGEDEHPFLVRFGDASEMLRVLDLVSGECVINQRIAITHVESSVAAATPVFCIGENRRIPAVFIFDYEGGELIQIDLEIEE